MTTDLTIAPIRAALRMHALDSLTLTGVGDDRTLSQAIPVDVAKRLVASLEARSVPASWARDNDDGSLAWVYC